MDTVPLAPNQNRTAQRLTDGQWVDIDFEAIRAGDRVRISEADGVPLQEAVATSDAELKQTADGALWQFMGTLAPEAGQESAAVAPAVPGALQITPELAGAMADLQVADIAEAIAALCDDGAAE